MRATVERQDVETALKWHSAGSPLRLLHAQVENGLLIIESSSEIAWKRSALPARNAVDGEAKFSMARLTDQMKAVRSGDLDIEVVKNNVITKVGRSKASIPTVLDIAAFWRPKGEVEEIAEADAQEFLWGLKAASYAAARASLDAAEELKAVQVVIDDAAINMYATDSYRLASIQIDCMASRSKRFLVMPAPFISSLPLMGDPVTLLHGDGHLGMRGPVHSTMTRALAGKPRDITPALRRADNYPDCATVPTKELTDAISGVSAGPHGRVEIEFNDDYVVVANGLSGDVEGRTEVEIAAEVDPGLNGHSILAAAANLTEMLRAIRAKQVRLHTGTGPTDPLILREPDEESLDSRYLGMVALVRKPR
jgi:DNA polymerase III sliding clamp (beta) subunit (PCNA family)